MLVARIYSLSLKKKGYILSLHNHRVLIPLVSIASATTAAAAAAIPASPSPPASGQYAPTAAATGNGTSSRGRAMAAARFAGVPRRAAQSSSSSSQAPLDEPPPPALTPEQVGLCREALEYFEGMCGRPEAMSDEFRRLQVCMYCVRPISSSS